MINGIHKDGFSTTPLGNLFSPNHSGANVTSATEKETPSGPLSTTTREITQEQKRLLSSIQLKTPIDHTHTRGGVVGRSFTKENNNYDYKVS